MLRQDFTGLAHQGSYEMLPEEFADTLLVPSNATEFLPEFDEPEERTAAIRTGIAAVVAELHDGPAATADGLNVRWTFGGSSAGARPRQLADRPPGRSRPPRRLTDCGRSEWREAIAGMAALSGLC